MKTTILMTMALVATLFTFSNFVSVPASTPSSTAITKEELKAKFVNSKAGQLLIKKMEKQAIKKQERLEKQLKKAEERNDVKKIQKIKEKQAADLGGIGKKLMIGGLIILLAGIAIWWLVSITLGSLLWSLGGLAITIGFILWLVGEMS